MNISKPQLAGAVDALLAQDRYKPLSPHIGGKFWATEALWALIGAWPNLAAASLEAMAATALAVPGAVQSLLADFLADLFDILAILGEEAGDIPGDAEGFENSPAGQTLLGLVAPEQFLLNQSGADPTLRALAAIVNPMAVGVGPAGAAAKNAAEAGGRIASKATGSRTLRRLR